MKLLNGQEIRQYLNISTTVFYKFKRAGMPYHQLPEGRAYYLADEFEYWLKEAGFHKDTVAVWNK